MQLLDGKKASSELEEELRNEVELRRKEGKKYIEKKERREKIYIEKGQI